MQANLKKFAQIKALIATAGSRFVSIDFVKVDGSDRTMLTNPARLAAHMRRDTSEKSESHQRGAATRKAQNPNLLNVWDQTKDAPRSINMATIKRMKIDGVSYTIRD